MQRAGRRRNYRCRWHSKGGTTFTLTWDTFCARAIANCVAFPVVLRARPQRELFSTPVSTGITGLHICICARNLEVLTPEPNHKKIVQFVPF